MNALIAIFFAIVARSSRVHVGRHREEHRRAAERIDDRQQRRDHEQHPFDEVAQVGGHDVGVKTRVGVDARCVHRLH